MNVFQILRPQKVRENALGEDIYETKPAKDFLGYLDLLTGGEFQPIQESLIVASSHVFITEDTSFEIEVSDILLDVRTGQKYEVTYPDEVMGIGHHYEVYCKKVA